jgi:phosphinothricin acetyltransferase
MSTPTRILVRPAREQDMAAVAKIHAHYVAHSTCTFEVEAPDAAEMVLRYRKVTRRGGPFLVAQAGDAVVGHAYAGPRAFGVMPHCALHAQRRR